MNSTNVELMLEIMAAKDELLVAKDDLVAAKDELGEHKLYAERASAQIKNLTIKLERMSLRFVLGATLNPPNL